MENAYQLDFGNETDEAVAMLLRIEVDFGVTMAYIARRAREFGDTDEFQRMKYHATSALSSVTQHKHRTCDAALDEQCRELTALVATL